MTGKALKREPSRVISISFPLSELEEIDTLCASNFMSRTSWIVTAAKEKLENDRTSKTTNILKKLLQVEQAESKLQKIAIKEGSMN